MPSKILMNLQTPQAIAARQMAAFQYYNQINHAKPAALGARRNLSSGMIDRIHLARSGCGCGK